MKQTEANLNEDYRQDCADESSDDQLDKASFVFFGLDFQLAELRYRGLEVNLTKVSSLLY